MFGVAPPQTLYHTRQASVALPLPPPPPGKGAISQPVSPVLGARARPPSAGPIKIKLKKKKAERPGTSDSNRQLLRGDSDESPTAVSLGGDVYGNYRASLNSLNDILDRVRVAHLLVIVLVKT